MWKRHHLCYVTITVVEPLAQLFKYMVLAKKIFSVKAYCANECCLLSAKLKSGALENYKGK